MGQKEMADWRKLHPEAGLLVLTKRRAKWDGQKVLFDRAAMGRLWADVEHKCELCHKPVEFEYGRGFKNFDRRGIFVRRDPGALYVIDNMMLTCYECERKL